MISPDIFSWIKSEESKFETQRSKIGDNWDWNFRDHVQVIFHLKNGVFYQGENDNLRYFKQVMDPMLQTAYWTEDIDAKDITFYIDDTDTGKVKSFLFKKYHDEVYIRENDVDAMIDSISESDIDYGGVIVQDGNDLPEVIPLMSIAFCDQTNLNGGPIAIKYNFSPSKLRSMSSRGWGNKKNGATISIEDLCVLATEKKESSSLGSDKNEVTGKNIEIYIIKGDMPSHYLSGDNNMETYMKQIQVVAFYTDKDSKKQGVFLYRKQDFSEDSILTHTSNEVFGRALGRGYGEALVGPQIWSNFTSIHKYSLIETASKSIIKSDDPNFTANNDIKNMDNLDVVTLTEGTDASVMQTANLNNIAVFENASTELYQDAQLVASAFDPLIGKEASSGTTFRGQERSVIQGKGSHERNRGKRAKFIEHVYRKLIIPRIKNKIKNGQKFLAELSSEELNWIAERLSKKDVDKIIVDAILKNGQYVTEEQKLALIEVRKQAIIKEGNKKLLEIIADEFEDIEIKLGINVAGKQKDLVSTSDKLLSIFQTVFTNPQAFMEAMKIPALAKSFENILEMGGMSIANFSSLLNSTQSKQPMQIPQDTSAQQSAPVLNNMN